MSASVGMISLRLSLSILLDRLDSLPQALADNLFVDEKGKKHIEAAVIAHMDGRELPDWRKDAA